MISGERYVGEPTTVSELLQHAELQDYTAAFEAHGYDSLSQLRNITDKDFAELVKSQCCTGFIVGDAAAQLEESIRRYRTPFATHNRAKLLEAGFGCVGQRCCCQARASGDC